VLGKNPPICFIDGNWGTCCWGFVAPELCRPRELNPFIVTTLDWLGRILFVSTIVEDLFFIIPLLLSGGGGQRDRRLIVNKSPAAAVWDVWWDEDLNKWSWNGWKFDAPLIWEVGWLVDIKSMEDANEWCRTFACCPKPWCCCGCEAVLFWGWKAPAEIPWDWPTSACGGCCGAAIDPFVNPNVRFGSLNRLISPDSCWCCCPWTTATVCFNIFAECEPLRRIFWYCCLDRESATNLGIQWK